MKVRGRVTQETYVCPITRDLFCSVCEGHASASPPSDIRQKPQSSKSDLSQSEKEKTEVLWWRRKWPGEPSLEYTFCKALQHTALLPSFKFTLPLSHTLPTKHFLWWVSNFFHSKDNYRSTLLALRSSRKAQGFLQMQVSSWQLQD